jgi:hypothetical protein
MKKAVKTVYPEVVFNVGLFSKVTGILLSNLFQKEVKCVVLMLILIACRPLLEKHSQRPNVFRFVCQQTRCGIIICATLF